MRWCQTVIFVPVAKPVQHIKVLHLISAFQLGGAELVAFRLATQVRSATGPDGQPVKISHAIATVFKRDNAYANAFRAACEERGILVYELGQLGRTLDRFTGWLGLEKVVRTYQPTVIHSHTDIPDFQLGTWLRLLYSPQRHGLIGIIRTIHNEQLWATWPAFARWTERGIASVRQYGQPDAVIGLAPLMLTAYQDLQQRCGTAPSDWQEAIPNPLHEVRFRTRAEVNHPLRLLFAGRMTAQKGFDVLIEAMTNLPDATAQAISVDFYGEGDQAHLLGRLSDSLLQYSIHPPTFNLADRFADYDCLLLPSRFEGVPLAVIEAQRTGLPVLAGPAQGLQMALPERWPLRLADPLQADDLVDLLTQFADGRIDLKALKHQLLTTTWPDDTSVDRYAGWYQRVAQGSL